MFFVFVLFVCVVFFWFDEGTNYSISYPEVVTTAVMICSFNTMDEDKSKKKGKIQMNENQQQ